MQITMRILVLALLGLVAVASWSPALDNPALEQVDAGMKRALATFAVARTLNAAISLAQGTEVTAGFGAELTFSVGQVLDPINDLVESFSNLMLMASVAFGIQKVLLMIGQYQYVKWALVAVLTAWGALYAFRVNRPRWLDMALLLMLMVRFAIPVVTLGTDAVYTQFLEQDYQGSNAGLNTAAQSVDQTLTDLRAETDAAAKQPAPPPPAASTTTPEGKSMFERAGEMFSDLTDSIKQTFAKFDPRPYLQQLQEQAAQTTQHIIDLIVVFLLQTVLVPLTLLWLMYAALRSALAGHASR